MGFGRTFLSAPVSRRRRPRAPCLAAPLPTCAGPYGPTRHGVSQRILTADELCDPSDAALTHRARAVRDGAAGRTAVQVLRSSTVLVRTDSICSHVAAARAIPGENHRAWLASLSVKRCSSDAVAVRRCWTQSGSWTQAWTKESSSRAKARAKASSWRHRRLPRTDKRPSRIESCSASPGSLCS